MSRDVCGICWCPYDEDGECGCILESSQVLDQCSLAKIKDDESLLRQAYKVMGLIGADLVCETAHHEKKDRHAIGEPCPIQKRWHEIFAAIKERLNG